jgi:hypothetical protein
MRESGIVLYDDQLVSVSVGTASHVEFDFMEIWEYKKKSPDFDPFDLMFYHVHPEGFLDYSSLDLECIKGLTIAFGYPIYFSIITFEGGDLNDLKYNRVNFQFIDGKMNDAPHFYLSNKYLLLLKYLSYYKGEK